jgi:hypothetical protein
MAAPVVMAALRAIILQLAACKGKIPALSFCRSLEVFILYPWCADSECPSLDLSRQDIRILLNIKIFW